MAILLGLLLAASKPAPAPRSAAAPGAVVIAESGPRWNGAPISLDLKDADLVDVCLSFSKIARANIVVDPGVRGKVTVRMKDVPWDWCPGTGVTVAARLRLADEVNVAPRDSMLLCIGPGVRRRDRSQCAGALWVRAAQGHRRCCRG